ncbi:MAG: mismatch-specific DNA-glycosylase [Betaproteobacteria bacterium]|nr:mismatch-specific DNA-glycosylase [Betaproteobacteria bacterium]
MGGCDARHGARLSRNVLVPDLLVPELRLVFCGTAPSKASAAARAYYAKPGNRFWPALHAVGLTPRRIAPQDYAELLTLGMGLTDLCKSHAGTDAELPEGAFDVSALKRKLKKFRPRMIAFTSKNAGQAAFGHAVHYGLQQDRIADVEAFVLCSPSGLATRFFDIAIWQQLSSIVHAPGPAEPS